MSTIRMAELVPSPAEDCEALNNAFTGTSFLLLFNTMFHSKRVTILCVSETLWCSRCVLSVQSDVFNGEDVEAVIVFRYCCLVLGLGTDEKALIRILGRRNAAQRKLIREAYQQIYNASLIDSLNDELSGDFRVPSFAYSLSLSLWLTHTQKSGFLAVTCSWKFLFV